jgi:RES domain-containing protein
VIVTTYRITKAAYATSIWTGAGSRDYGGRWNSKGVAVVYTAENRSLAAMDQLVHLIKPRVLRGYVIASIAFDNSRVQRISSVDLPTGCNDPIAPPESRRIGDEWVAAGRDLVLALPSVIIPGEWNYLLNPMHPDFSGLAKSVPEPFVYDGRLD